MNIFDLTIIYKKENENDEYKTQKLIVNEEMINKFTMTAKIKESSEQEKQFSEIFKNIIDYKGNIYNIDINLIEEFWIDNPRFEENNE